MINFTNKIPVSFIVTILCLIIPIHATFAETVPVSKCVTSATKATHAGALARMEKDVAPYTQTAKATSAIQKYRDGMVVAWNALNEPYCGYGAYGISSAVKSYSKSITRTRTSFLDEVKNLSKSPVATPTPVAPTPLKTSQPVVAPTINTGSIPSGLSRGMRSTAVGLLQKKLAAYFKITPDASTVTGFFGAKTETLVEKFQLAQKIITSTQSPGAGLVGPKTALKLNSLK